jgi:hypothetical protein
VKPKPRVSRARTAKPKAEASAATEETTDAAAKPRRRAPARTKKAEKAEE